MNASEFAYGGKELELFSYAKNWKRYWSAHVRPYLGLRVLEVGAGTGSNTPFLNKGALEWICVEPDKQLAAMLMERQRTGAIAATGIVIGRITDLPRVQCFDSIVYIDVLEHIKEDSAEIEAATARLAPNGTLVVLAPAHAWLFSPFDSAIGHYRRYSKPTLSALTRPELELVSLRQLDSVGTIASLANRLLMRSDTPTQSQILCWDRIMVPLSQLSDLLLGYRFGRSIIAVWRRRAELDV
jgi:SAM-dependent methyltransferase